MDKRALVFTSESVSEGHPDKVADQISDGVLDAALRTDKNARVACETLVKNNTVVLAGELTTRAHIDFEKIVRSTIRDIGYTEPALGFDAESCEIVQYISQQSQDINQGVDRENEIGAGDQGIMFGFACSETKEMMPLPIALSHALVKELARQRKEEKISFLKPDAKSQVSVLYKEGKPASVETVVLSTQHAEDASLEQVREFIEEVIIPRVIPEELRVKKPRLLVNPTGRFVIGGPVGDSGLTGRKIIVDTYGGYSRHGGGAFSGKDPTKVDRSASYAARYIAKNIVASGLSTQCEIQLSYAIGVAEPVSIYVNAKRGSQYPESKIEQVVREVFDLTPRGIIEMLQLENPIFQQTAAYGHFGRAPRDDGSFTWEKTDKAEALRKAFQG